MLVAVAGTSSFKTLRWREMDSNFRYRGRRPASGRSLRAQRVETDAAKREFRIRQLLGCAALAQEWSARRRSVLSVSDPRERAAREPAGADRAPSSPSSARCASYRMRAD